MAGSDSEYLKNNNDVSFESILKANTEKPLKARVDELSDIVYKIFNVVIKIPEIIDNQLSVINTKLYEANQRVGICEYKTSNLETLVNNYKSVSYVPSSPQPVVVKVEEKPKSPESLRGAIMSELKILLEKRRGKDENED